MDELLEDAPGGFLIFSDEGLIIQANRTIARILARPAQSLVGEKFESLLTLAGRIFYQTHLFPLLSLHGEAEEIFLTLLASDRSEIPILLNSRRRQAKEGHEYHCLLMPVYQRKKYEAELLQARRIAEDALAKNERLQELTAELEANKQELDDQLTRHSLIHEDLARFGKIISHDMQEPLRKILVFTDIIGHEGLNVISANGKHALERIRIAGLRMRNLVESLKQYVMVDTPGAKPLPCDLSAVLKSAQEKVLSEAESTDIIIRSDTLPVVEGHCDQFSLLFYHLIANSIQFRKDNSAAEITVAVDSIQQNRYRNIKGKYQYADFARIEFSDKGKGFSPEYANYIFRLFEKVHPESHGLGFGLALCKKIVENHYGSISARSAIGQGASFTILLPLKHPEAAAIS